MTGYVSEIFCSIQGEGPLVGQKQVFVRTSGCSLACRWCDTGYSKRRVPGCTIHGRNGNGVRTLSNPLSVEQVVGEGLLVAEEHMGVETVSITGGEPLEQAEFVAGVAEGFKDAGLNVYLETAGVHDRELAGVLPFVDVIAMDVKLPSAFGSAVWDRHEAFLSRLRHTAFDRRLSSETGVGKLIFVKVVVDDRSGVGEIEEAARLIASFDCRIPFVLQPEARSLLSQFQSPGSRGVLNRLLEAGSAAASVVLEDVRVIPQVHKILNVR